MIHASIPKRVLSVDAFRGITILVMVFVNEVAGVRDVPVWMKHMPADADAMTFVDLVFPAFLFIVGMSVPFALNNRKQKGDSFWKIQLHILWRSLGLLVLGVFMVNAEEGVNESATGISGSLWSLLFYVFAILVWNVYTFKHTWIGHTLRIIGVAGLAWLAFIFRSGENGTATMQPHWWGILGLIGWAYLYACIIYQLLRGNIYLLLLAVAACVGLYMIINTGHWPHYSLLNWVGTQAGNVAHTSIVLCGIVLSQVFFGETKSPGNQKPWLKATVLALLFAVAAFLLRPYFKISKIYATPSWCLYSAAICTVLFSFLYWLVDVKGIYNWTNFFKAAATNPLLTYIIPGILYALCGVLHITMFPWKWQYGLPGIVWALFFAVVIMFIAKGLNKLRIRLQL